MASLDAAMPLALIVKWPPNLIHIGEAVFSSCFSLEGMPLPGGLSEGQIGPDGFYMCQQLVDNADADYWWATERDSFWNTPSNIYKGHDTTKLSLVCSGVAL